MVYVYKQLYRFLTSPLQSKAILLSYKHFKTFSSIKERLPWRFWSSCTFYGVSFFCTLMYIDNHYVSVTAVTGRSMQPTINPDDSKQSDWVFLDRQPKWDHTSVKRGDIVTYKTIRNPDSINIKRVVGLEGDTVTTLGYKKRVVLVPSGHCWLEGDNHLLSDDSNNVGPIPLGLVTARATHVVYPISRWQKLLRKFPHSRVRIDPGSDDSQVRLLPAIVSPNNWSHRT